MYTPRRCVVELPVSHIILRSEYIYRAFCVDMSRHRTNSGREISKIKARASGANLQHQAEPNLFVYCISNLLANLRQPEQRRYSHTQYMRYLFSMILFRFYDLKILCYDDEDAVRDALSAHIHIMCMLHQHKSIYKSVLWRCMQRRRDGHLKPHYAWMQQLSAYNMQAGCRCLLRILSSFCEWNFIVCSECRLCGRPTGSVMRVRGRGVKCIYHTAEWVNNSDTGTHFKWQIRTVEQWRIYIFEYNHFSEPV